jgi:hypothetical protein
MNVVGFKCGWRVRVCDGDGVRPCHAAASTRTRRICSGISLTPR